MCIKDHSLVFTNNFLAKVKKLGFPAEHDRAQSVDSQEISVNIQKTRISLFLSKHLILKDLKCEILITVFGAQSWKYSLSLHWERQRWRPGNTIIS